MEKQEALAATQDLPTEVQAAPVVIEPCQGESENLVRVAVAAKAENIETNLQD
jgi:hypothetical protein